MGPSPAGSCSGLLLQAAFLVCNLHGHCVTLLPAGRCAGCVHGTTQVRAEHSGCLQEAGADTAAFKRSLQDVDAKAARQLTGELTRAGASVYDALQHERELREVRIR